MQKKCKNVMKKCKNMLNKEQKLQKIAKMQNKYKKCRHFLVVSTKVPIFSLVDYDLPVS